MRAICWEGQETPTAICGSDDFLAAVARHRHIARETDAPRV
jgi:hypothetical protein